MQRIHILCLLNSRLYYFWLYYKGKRKGETLELFQKPLSEVPIKNAPRKAQFALHSTAEEILSLKKSINSIKNSQNHDRVKSLEKEIEQMVYKLYELTEEEVQIVEESVTAK